MKTIVRLAIVLLIVVIVANNSMLVGYSIGATRVYLELRFDGLSHNGALCEVSEFADNILRNLDFEDTEARAIQHELYTAHCHE